MRIWPRTDASALYEQINMSPRTDAIVLYEHWTCHLELMLLHCMNISPRWVAVFISLIVIRVLSPRVAFWYRCAVTRWSVQILARRRGRHIGVMYHRGTSPIHVEVVVEIRGAVTFNAWSAPRVHTTLVVHSCKWQRKRLNSQKACQWKKRTFNYPIPQITFFLLKFSNKIVIPLKPCTDCTCL